jgi:signal transduction histidine kinase/ligand-binding sensor domain-containing protein
MPLRHCLLPACALALVAAAQASAWAQPADIEAIPVSQDYVVRAWNVEDGLPNNNVDGIAQTPDGYLWVATWSGIGRFDGLRFTHFSTRDTPGIDTDECNVVFAAKDGSLWAGFHNGVLAHFHNGAFQARIPAAPNIAAESLTEDAGGAIWVGFHPNPRVARWKRGVVTEFSSRDGVGPGKFPVVQASRDGAIWLATSEGCAIFDDGRFQQFPASDGGDVRMGQARDGGMWVARGRQLFHYWKNGKRAVVADLAWLGGSEPVAQLLEDHDGNLWIGTRNSGLFRWRKGAFERIPQPSASVSALCEDNEGNLWIGTRGSGLIRLSPRCFFLRKAENAPQLIRNDNVTSLGVDAEGRLDLAQGFAFVRAVDSSNRTFAPPPVPIPAQGITTLLPDPRGGVWLGSLTNVLRCWWRGAYSVDESFPDAIASLLLDRRRNLWIGSIHDRLYLRRPDGARARVETPGLIQPRALAEDADGRVWAGTESGLVFRQKEDTAFEPVSLPGAKSGQPVRFLVPDGRETVWIGAFGAGLYRWRGGRVEKLPPDAGLPSGDLKALEIAPDGNFWFATDRGLYRVARREIEDVLDGRKSSLRAFAFGRNDGVPTLNFSHGFLHATARTPDGRIWFATTSGALEIDPGKLRKMAPPNPLVIEGVQVNGKPAPPADAQGDIVLPPQPGVIQIRYTMPQMSAPEQLRFRCRLLGSGDDSWYEAENQRTAVFSKLAPGSYTFEVAAAEPFGPWLPNPASVSFTVRAAWWETLWLRLAVVLAGAFALAALVRAIVHRRMQARIRRLEQESALERERSRIARDMHDELGARLTHIMLMSELAATEPEPAANLGKIAQAARTVSSTLDEIVWTTNPRNDTLEHLVGYIAEFAGEYLAPTGIDLHIELPAQIPPRVVSSEKRHNVLLVVKEALNNIVKHAGASRVQLRVTLAEDELRVVITDDGKGFDPAAVAPTSNGLANMRQRLLAISGALAIDTQPGRGATLTLSAKF